MRESFIFYKSFYDSIKELGTEDQVQIYNAIFNYQFYGEIIELKGVCKSIFMLIILSMEQKLLEKVINMQKSEFSTGLVKKLLQKVLLLKEILTSHQVIQKQIFKT